MSALSERELHEILEPVIGDGAFLTCYPGGGSPQERLRAFDSRVSDLHRTVHANDDKRAELDRNVLAVRRVLESDDAETATAIFSCARTDALQVLRLDVPVAAGLRFEHGYDVVPLLRALLRRRQYLVVQADTHRARLFAASPGTITNLADVEHPLEKKHHSSGERFGFEQNIIARHRDESIRHGRKELVEQIVQHWDAAHYSGLVLLGEHVTIEHLREALPARLRSLIAREEPAEWDDSGAEVRKTIHTIINDLQPCGLSQSTRERIFQNKSVAMGSTAVLEALDQGRVGAGGHGGLVVGPDTGEMIGRCTACRSLGAEPLGRCPKCQSPCTPAPLEQEVLVAALRRHIAVEFTDDAEELRPYGATSRPYRFFPPTPGTAVTCFIHSAT